MGEFMEIQNYPLNTTPSSSSTLTINRNSQTISKIKPKIRIIHIVAPEIIKTDVGNFRELVQRLTGKPTTDEEISFTKNKKPSRKNCVSSNKKMKADVRDGFHGGFREMVIKEEEEEESIWKGVNTGGGFLGGFGSEFDDFMQEINDQFPFLEGTTQMDVAYGESLQLLAN